jgi:hypothetical protein
MVMLLPTDDDAHFIKVERIDRASKSPQKAPSEHLRSIGEDDIP